MNDASAAPVDREAAIEQYFHNAVLPAARGSDPDGLVKWMRRQGRSWALGATREDAVPHAAAIAAYLLELAAELEDATDLAAIKAVLAAA